MSLYELNTEGRQIKNIEPAIMIAGNMDVMLFGYPHHISGPFIVSKDNYEIWKYVHNNGLQKVISPGELEGITSTLRPVKISEIIFLPKDNTVMAPYKLDDIIKKLVKPQKDLKELELKYSKSGK